MPATPERAAFVQTEFRSAVWQDPTVLAQYGRVARDTGDAPIETYFDSIDHVQIMANERGALLGSHSRAFRTKVGILVELEGNFAMSQLLPGIHVRDDELVADMDCACVSIESYDTDAGQTTFVTWGVI